MNDSGKILKQSFTDKEYRHGYVDEFLNAYIATQIKVLREQRRWSQKKLAKEAGMSQPRISVMENVNYASWSIKILRKIAESFDLALCVSFESFQKRIGDIEKFSRKTLERDSFDEDTYFLKGPNRDNVMTNTQYYKPSASPATSSQVILLSDYRQAVSNKIEDETSTWSIVGGI